MSRHGMVLMMMLALVTASATTASAQFRGWRGDRDRGRGDRTEPVQGGERSGENDRGAFGDAYGLVIDQNIFVRERGRRPPSVRPPGTRPAATQRTPEQTLMLTGIVIEEGELRAYFEHLASGTIQRVGLGEPIGRGHVIEIVIDAIAYAGQSTVQWVEIGHDLTGTPATTAPVAPASVAGGSPPAAGGEGGGAATPGAVEQMDPALMTAAERMRARARQLRGEN